MKYSLRIRNMREDRDLSQREIAALLKVGQKTYSDYELGKTRIPLESVIALAEFYQVSMDYICGLTDEPGKFPDSAKQADREKKSTPSHSHL